MEMFANETYAYQYAYQCMCSFARFHAMTCHRTLTWSARVRGDARPLAADGRKQKHTMLWLEKLDKTTEVNA